uniref:Uncharacterized protein n=1 Tax=Arundo donax TaxID=35708 RepID=A0A0A8ZI76_ARUDO
MIVEDQKKFSVLC